MEKKKVLGLFPVEQLGRTNEPDYLFRYHLTPFKWWPFKTRILLHRICRPDNDPWLHDHPFDFRTILLWGWYVEERFNLPYEEFLVSVDAWHDHGVLKRIDWKASEGRRQKARRKQIKHRWLSTFCVPASTQHRIIALRKDRPVWTLVFRSPKKDDWGFWIDDELGAQKIMWWRFLGFDGPGESAY